MSSHRYLTKQRRDAAEEVCWALILMMGLGGLDIPQGWRDFLFEDYKKWVDLAVATGVLPEESAQEKREREEGYWQPRRGMYVWLNYPDSPLPVGRIIDLNEKHQALIAQYRDEKGLFGQDYISRHAVSMHLHFLLPFPYRSPAWKRVFGE